MRKQFLAVLLPLLVVVLITAAAQTQSAGTDASRHAALQKVNVVRTDDGVSVEITARGAVKPQLSTLDHPARVVVDLPNTVVATSRGLIGVDSDGVKDVRLGMDGQTTPTTRVVVDLTKACRYELVPGSDNTAGPEAATPSQRLPRLAAAVKVRPCSPSRQPRLKLPPRRRSPVAAKLLGSGQGSRS